MRSYIRSTKFICTETCPARFHFPRFIPMEYSTFFPYSNSDRNNSFIMDPLDFLAQHHIDQSTLKNSRKIVPIEEESPYPSSSCFPHLITDVRDTNTSTTHRRTSTRGRRRYRRTLLRNCESPLVSSYSSTSHSASCNGLDEHLQRRAYLRNAVPPPNTLSDTPLSMKSISTADQTPRISCKPSWDGGRLVKLLQGHGLNIDSCEKKRDTRNNSWQEYNNVSFIKQSNCNSSLVDEASGGRQASKDSNTLVNRLGTANYLVSINRSPNINNVASGSIGCSAASCCSPPNNMEVSKEVPINSSPIDAILLDSRGNKASISNRHLISQNSINGEAGISMETIGCSNANRYSSIRMHLEDIDEIDTLDDPDDELVSQIISCSSNSSTYNTSHEELFVTLGETPTSKSYYNFPSIFIPNQD
ncbi:uncharacterized protein CMU_036340 [Cryptosporidium muris RN66]|uniref:Uncharacterized protein n=1 Tax=Cryptosporidium muris (strain RN66) TaxID=441375 RepID=B6AGX0_CRYMR|nr:uncharacterized protein CMU_036340 [Cryptosporidium muris RN66]EEA07461.1 hypothetical protein, conserved [Cryptosporidium muris RN66]|eukprot:XP_002141810.1 hypothetical protein [Cryptosporidium muris RN66]